MYNNNISNNTVIFFTAIAILMTMIVVLVLMLLIKIIKINRQKRDIEYSYNIFKLVLRNISKTDEVIILDKNEEIVFTTHPILYKNKNDILKKIMTRLKNKNDANRILSNFHTKNTFQIMLDVHSNELNDDNQIILSVSQIDNTNAVGTFASKIVKISNICLDDEATEKLSTKYEILESIIDRMPMGVFYTDDSDKITHINSTLVHFLNAQKSQIIGEHISSFFRGFNTSDASKQSVIIKRRFLQECACTIVKPSIVAHKTMTPWFAIIDHDILSSQRTFNDPKQQNKKLSNNSYNILATSTIIPTVVLSKTGNITTFNKPFESLLHSETNNANTEIKNQAIVDYIDEASKDSITTAIDDISEDRFKNTIAEIKLEHSDNVFMTYISKIANETNLIMQLIDISGQKSLERQFLQSQKMKTIGELAGGIAHDFNNILTAILGFCDLILQRHTKDDRSYSDAQQIKQCTKRASDLVKKLLAFSRQQTLQPKVISITDTLYEFSNILKRAAGNSIDLQIIYNREMWPIEVDVGQLEQVILNLVINSKDATNNEGNIVIKTQNQSIEAPTRCTLDTIKQGDYVVIEVSDNGCGIDDSIINKIFDPFFTTKNKYSSNPTKSGSGLGLSTVYGIVKQTGGYVDVASVVGKGTTFKIYFPRYTGAQEIKYVNNEEQNQALTDLSGNHTILFVEDEDKIREFACRALRNNGYNVIEANCGTQAIEIAQKEAFDLLITDVLMPKMDGPTLNKKLSETIPNLKTIFISGYAEDTFRQNITKNSNMHFIQKPFNMVTLLSKIKEVFCIDNDE